MPFLSGFRVVDTPEEVPNPFEDSRRFAFRSLDGTELLPFSDRDYIARWGITGLGVPKRVLVEEDMPGQDGSDLLEVKIAARDWFMPVWVGSDFGHRQHLENMAYMRRFFNHRGAGYQRAGGTFDLVATSVMGERSLRSTYVEGMDGDWAQDSTGSYRESFGIKARSVRPYWQGPRWSTQIIRRAYGAAWFGEFPGQLVSSRALGADIPVTVEGDLESWVRVNLKGPASSVTIATAGGLLISIPDGLGEGETAVIETDPALRRIDYGAMFDGVCDWSRVAPMTRWVPLDAGQQQITIDLQDATAESYAYADGAANYETPW